VLVQRIKADTKTAGGIFLPDSAVKDLNEAKVLAVGPGAVDKEGKRLPMSVASGDKVLIPQVSGYAQSERRCCSGFRTRDADVCIHSSAAARSRSATRSSRFSGTTSKFSSDTLKGDNTDVFV